MNDDQYAERLAEVTKKQENIAVVIGVIFTLTLCTYFFTYAMLVDKGLSGALWLMGTSSLLMLLVLIFLKRISLFLTRLWLGRRPAYKDVFATLAEQSASKS